MLANKWVHPTRFTGDYPDWNGHTFLDWTGSVFHPGDDYNFGYGADDLGQDVWSMADGVVVHTSNSTKGYGNICVIKHNLGYNLKRFVKEVYGIETDILYSLYAHLKDVIVAVGNEVNSGSLIGHVGKSGTESPHLHAEVYAPIGEVADLPWRYYPTGWAKEKVQQFWLPVYKFIEATKQTEIIVDSFLGKPKDYWIQVEKDRENLLKQITEIDKVWAKKVSEAEKTISSQKDEIASLIDKAKKLVESMENVEKKYEEQITKLKESLRNAELRNAELIKDNASNYKFIESLKLVVAVIKNMWRSS